VKSGDIDWPSWVIMGTGWAGLMWLFYCTVRGLDPVGWFR
jgi:hypothetical protein